MTFRRLLLTASCAAFAISPALAQQATSTAQNTQTMSGNTNANMRILSWGGQTSAGASASALAAGNTVSAANTAGGLNLRSRQTMSGYASSSAELTGDDVCCVAVAIANTQANALEAQSQGGQSQVNARQTSTGPVASADARMNIRNSQNASTVAAAAANNAATAAKDGRMDVNLRQSSSTSVYATADHDACCTGQSVIASTASGNAWSHTAETADTYARIRQSQTGGEVKAWADAYQVKGYNVTAAAQATANSQTLASKWAYANLNARQTNSSEVAADARVTLGSWNGQGAVSASGVGNAVLASNIGSDLNVDVGQVNSGGVSANAEFTGTGESQAATTVLNASAIGNAFTGFVCSYCGDAAASGKVSQSNSGSIASTGTITTSGAGGLIGSAFAIGNSASFISTTSH